MSEKNHDFGSLVCIYAQLLPRVREAAKRLGYAIAIHGSMYRDLDLVAVPWIEAAGSPQELVESVREAKTAGYAPFVARIGLPAVLIFDADATGPQVPLKEFKLPMTGVEFQALIQRAIQ